MFQVVQPQFFYFVHFTFASSSVIPLPFFVIHLLFLLSIFFTFCFFIHYLPLPLSVAPLSHYSQMEMRPLQRQSKKKGAKMHDGTLSHACMCSFTPVCKCRCMSLWYEHQWRFMVLVGVRRVSSGPNIHGKRGRGTFPEQHRKQQ